MYLTDEGRAALEQIGRLSREHVEEIFASLSDAEKAQLAEFLRRIVAQQGLTPGVHPALRRMGGEAK